MEKKQKQLTTMIFKGILSIAVFMIILAAVGYACLSIMTNNRILLPANAAENYLEQQKEILAAKFDESKLSYLYQYALYDSNKTLLHSNMSARSLQTISDHLGKTEIFGSGGIQYQTIRYTDETLILRYKIKAGYSNPLLNEILPSWDILGILIFLIAVIIYCYIVAKKMSEIVRKNMDPIINSTELISKQELEFDIPKSEITEFNEINRSLTKMKTALAETLEKQWSGENEKQQQLAAIAHDINTPLTTIIARAELLLEFSTSADDNTSLEQIVEAGMRIQRLVDILMNISEKKHQPKIEAIKLQTFFSAFKKEGAELAKNKNQEFLFSVPFESEVGYFDQVEVERAIFNLLYNAFEYGAKNGTIHLTAEFTGRSILKVCVYNSGSHFSEEDLNSAAQLFYRGQKERSADKHYGIGLYVAEQTAKAYNGKLVLSNTEEGVEIWLIIDVAQPSPKMC